ncbi:hypothetical protein [Clostridium sp.]|uniref:hypothetical protein n=1 Tax=Clostridium sp. TaxID=1506 RepID=UPI001A42A17F|nr:hypothetical protein [Clostridium sp.]MBK5239869.1 hypothetical protein [Clostridium sp.]
MDNFGVQISLIIDNISSKLGVAADKLYPALRKQAFIDGITGSIWIIISLILIIFLIIKLFKWFKPAEDDFGDMVIPDSNTDKIVMGIFTLIAAIIMFSFNFNSTITALFNPDWYMINNIIQNLSDIIK